MKTKSQGIILFWILITYFILWRIFQNFISSTFNLVLWIIFIIALVGISIYMLIKKPFSKKQDSKRPTLEHRMGVLEQMGIFSSMIILGYILGFICIGLGVFALFYSPQGQSIFIGMTILGLIVIGIVFFVNRSKKRRNK